MSSLRVFTFAADFGLPTVGPFALKLLAWLNLAGIPYSQHHVDDSRKGPKGKSPWVEIDGEPVADSGVIIETLAKRHGFDIDASLDPVARADARMWSLTFEEHFHQVLEWELFGVPAGNAYIETTIRRDVPAVMVPIVSTMLRRHFLRQLWARGVSRHGPDGVTVAGIADVDAMLARLGANGPFLFGDKPCSADLSVFGMVAPMALWTMPTPVADYIKSKPAIHSYVDQMLETCGMAMSRAA